LGANRHDDPALRGKPVTARPPLDQSFKARMADPVGRSW